MTAPRLIVSPSAAERLAAARAFLAGRPAGLDALVLGTSRGAADDVAYGLAAESGATFGVARASLAELITTLAVPELAREGLSPHAALGDEAVATRAAFDALEDGALAYFTPVAGMPGFPRALARTLLDMRLAGLEPDQLPRGRGTADVAELFERAQAERRRAGAADFVTLMAAAARRLADPPPHVAGRMLVLVDIAVHTVAEARVVRALIEAAGPVLITVPDGDTRTLDHLSIPRPRRGAVTSRARALDRLQRNLFEAEVGEPGTFDESVQLFSAPGEGREAVEIARRLAAEAARGVPFDEMAVLVRAPQTYLGVLEHAFDRAGIPAWFQRGTRRPDPAGRALLALLACAEEDLSARRFAEYVSLGQVPRADVAPDEGWAPPTDEITEAVVPDADRPDDPQPEDELQAARARGETDRDIAGTLRAPWRWEDLIVEAAVIGGIDRWERRLAGLQREYDQRLREARKDDYEAAQVAGLARDGAQLRALRDFALPVLSEMADWPVAAKWGEWLTALRALVPRVVATPARVLRVLQELEPLASVGPVGVREVRDVLTARLSTLTHEPPRRRHGRVFVGTPHAARGRAFRVVAVPGLAERMFPQRIREDALLPDDRRLEIDGDGRLATQPERAADERLQLTLAVGAASERLYLSFPRIEIDESRPRVPSFYVLDIVRAIEGRLPAAAGLGERAFQAGGTTLAWPAPRDAASAIDDFEHDLATMGALLRSHDAAATRGRARYLYELSPELQRSLTSRWLRWHRRQWETADGLVRVVGDTTGKALAAQRLTARPYSPTALQRYAACPYQFLLAAVYRLGPLEIPAPLQQIDPLTRGDLFHRIQASALRRLQADHLLPVTEATLPRALKMLEWAVTDIEKEAYDRLAPAIDRVWRDEMAAMTQDLKVWMRTLVDEGREWIPERFEYAFGLSDTEGRDEHSTPDAAIVSARFELRGSIDLIERHRQTGFLRVTDHKTGRNRTKPHQTIVDGGRVLQPVVYGLALEALMPEETVYSGRLSFCTSLGGFTQHEIPLMGQARKAGIEALEIIDRSIEHGLLAARPAPGACTYCDFRTVCGRHEEQRTSRKDRTRFADLDALRNLP